MLYICNYIFILELLSSDIDLSQGSANFPIKGQTVSMSGFADHTVSVLTDSAVIAQKQPQTRRK